jgi:hypothetical protein
LGGHRLGSVSGRLEERERELQVIVDALEEVSAGLGRAVVVSGAAGIGKTSLLDLARDAAHKRNFAVASARGSDLRARTMLGSTQCADTTKRISGDSSHSGQCHGPLSQAEGPRAAAGDRTLASQTSRSTSCLRGSPPPAREPTAAVGRHCPDRAILTLFVACFHRQHRILKVREVRSATPTASTRRATKLAPPCEARSVG